MCRLWHFPETLSLTHVKRRLSNTVHSFTCRRRTVNRHMGTAALRLSEAIPQGYIHQSSHKRQAQCLSCRCRQAQERFERLIEGMKQAQGITEQLKEENALEWTGRHNDVRACAREVVEREIIYS